MHYVRSVIPEVEVVQLPADPTSYRRTLQSLEWFDTLAFTEEDKREAECIGRRACASGCVRKVRGLKIIFGHWK